MLTKCPHCEKEMNVRGEYLGREGKCPKCGDSFVVSDNGNSEMIPESTEAANSISTLVIVAFIAAVLAGVAGFGSGMVLNRPKVAQQQIKLDAAVSEAVSPLKTEIASLQKQKESLAEKLSQSGKEKRILENRVAMQTQVAQEAVQEAVQAKRTIQAEAKRKIDAAEGRYLDLLAKIEKPSPKTTVPKPDKEVTTRFTRLDVGRYGLVKFVAAQQIIDENNAIVSIILENTNLIQGKYHSIQRNGRIVQSVPTIKKTVWLKGVSTLNYVDGSHIMLNTTCAITGTKSYTNSLGAKTTVFVMETVK